MKKIFLFSILGLLIAFNVNAAGTWENPTKEFKLNLDSHALSFQFDNEPSGGEEQCYDLFINGKKIEENKFCIAYENLNYTAINNIKVYKTDLKDWVLIYSGNNLGMGDYIDNWIFVNMKSLKTFVIKEDHYGWCGLGGNILSINGNIVEDNVKDYKCLKQPQLLGFMANSKVAYSAKLVAPLTCASGVFPEGDGETASYEVCQTTKTTLGVSKDFSKVYFSAGSEYINNKSGYEIKPVGNINSNMPKNMLSWKNNYSYNLKTGEIIKEDVGDKIKTTLVKSLLGINENKIEVTPVEPTPSTNSQVSKLATKLKGRILLQVESKGEAWYINPDTAQRHYLGRPDDAFKVMRELGLGITNKNFDSFNGYAPKRLSGKILLKVEDAGKAYYVNPIDLKMYYLGRPADAFNVMRELGLGIKNSDLDQIETAVTE